MFKFNEAEELDFFLKVGFMFALLSVVVATGDRVFTLIENDKAMRQGYEQVVDPESRKITWKKVIE